MVKLAVLAKSSPSSASGLAPESQTAVLGSPLSQFRDKGYQVVRNVIPPDTIAELHRVLGSEVDKALALLERVGVKPDIATAAKDIATLLSGPAANGLDHDARVLMTGHFPTQLRLSKSFWEIPRTPALQDILRAALGSDRLRMHMPPMARFILPNNFEAGVPAHQDASYNDHMNGFVTVWLPLVAIDAQCGGVTIYEGRKDGLIPVTRLKNNGVWLDGVSVEGLTPVDCVPMAPGDILIFNPHVVHQSMPNTSGKIRFSIDCRFFGGDAQTSKHCLDMTTWSVMAPNTAEK
jgi:ectoine hydroxylase-related dioxygenase (phytanoyl-CoA dioxygenase family)